MGIEGDCDCVIVLKQGYTDKPCVYAFSTLLPRSVHSSDLELLHELLSAPEEDTQVGRCRSDRHMAFSLHFDFFHDVHRFNTIHPIVPKRIPISL